MKSSDLGVATLYPTENYLTALPVKAFEYMSCSLPIVMSNFPYWKEVFKDCALFVNPKDPKDISSKIKYLLKNSNIAKELSMSGRILIKKKYSWEKESEKLELILVFPPGVTKAALIPEQQDRGTIREEHDKRGRLQKVWSVEKVQREEKFSYIVKCEQLPALVEKYLNKRTRRSSLQ